jgi:hypothetical protein
MADAQRAAGHRQVTRTGSKLTVTAEVETSKFVPVLKPEELPKGAPLSRSTHAAHVNTNDLLSREPTPRKTRTYAHAVSSIPAYFP